MSLTPSILNHLFKNGGIGPELNDDIVPAVHASDADKLTNSVTITLIGDANGSVEFDGSQNVTINTSVAAAASAASADKLATTTSFITDLESGDSASYNGTQTSMKPGVTGTLPTGRGGTGRTDGKALGLSSKRTITFTGNTTGSFSFDGTGDVSTALTTSYATAAGTADTAGTAGTADKLSSARTIELTGDVEGSANFDGSKDIKISTTANVGSDWSTTKTIAVNTTYSPTADGYIIVSALCDDDPNWSEGVNISLGPTSSRVTVTAKMLFGTHYSLGGDTCVYPVKSGAYFTISSRGNAGATYAYFIPK